MSRDTKIVAAWDFDRLIPCHGDVIETGAKQVWLDAFKVYLDNWSDSRHIAKFEIGRYGLRRNIYRDATRYGAR
jgi:hypothetical protein